MTVQISPKILDKLKNLNVRIRKSFKERILVFTNNPNDPRLNNHLLRKPYEGLRSIDITNDYRAIYEECQENGEEIAYFTTLGTHNELYTSGF